MISKKALHDVKEYKQEENNLWNYHSKLYYYHENRKNIAKRNFKGYTSTDCMNGNVALFDICEWQENWYDVSNPEEKRTIGTNTQKYFSEIVDMCKKKQIDLILITGYVDFNKAQHKTCAELAQKYDVKYIDINECIEDVGFLYKFDIHDGWHFNLSGAIKWTDYLGNYLVKNYEFSDRRNDCSCNWYKKQSEFFHNKKK